MRFLQCGSVRDALPPWLTRQGIDDERRRPDQTFLPGGSSLEGHALIPEGLGKTAATRTEGLRKHKVGVRGIDLRRAEATSIQDGKVGAHALAALLIGATQFMLEQGQRSQDADGHRPSTTRGWCRQSCGDTLRDGADERRPRQGVSLLPDGMHDGDKSSDLQAGSGTAQPMLERTHKAHR